MSKREGKGWLCEVANDTSRLYRGEKSLNADGMDNGERFDQRRFDKTTKVLRLNSFED